MIAKRLGRKRMRLVGRFASTAVVGAALALAFAVPSNAATTHTAAPVKTASIMAVPAALTPPPASCPRGDVCIFPNEQYAGGIGTFTGTNSNWGLDFGSSHGKCNPMTAAADNQGGWNDCVTSLANNTTDTFWFYIDAGCSPTDTAFNLVAGDGFDSLKKTDGGAIHGHPAGFYNDKLTSDSRTPTARFC